MLIIIGLGSLIAGWFVGRVYSRYFESFQRSGRSLRNVASAVAFAVGVSALAIATAGIVRWMVTVHQHERTVAMFAAFVWLLPVVVSIVWSWIRPGRHP